MRVETHWYNIGEIDGKTVFLGGYETEGKAVDDGLSKNFDNAQFDTKHYPTSDKATAKSMWKHEQAERTGDLRIVFKQLRNK
jgi:hypothetical protein